MTTIANITLDGQFADWPANAMIMTANNAVAGYQIYGALLNDATLGDNYVIGIDATDSTDPVIGPGHHHLSEHGSGQDNGLQPVRRREHRGRRV